MSNIKEEGNLLDYDHYGLPVYELNGKTWAYAEDYDAAHEAAVKVIEDSLWAFNANFIVDECELDSGLAPFLEQMQSQMAERSNEIIRSLIEKCCGIEEFVDAAIAEDGITHFLSTYDGLNYPVDGTDEIYYRLD